MPLLFAHPGLIWFLPTILLPVVFHLFFRLKRQVHVFPSLMFFTRLDPRLSAKRKIHEWLILFLRCLLIALILLALLRPTFGVGGGGGGHVARMVLIDNSGSMAGPGANDSSKFALAIRATQQLIKLSRPGDALSVRLMLPDATVSVPKEFNPDLNALRDSLDKLKPTEGSASVGKAIRQALVALSGERQSLRELHIITDLQRKNWGVGELEGEASFLPIQIVVHRLESKTPPGGWVALSLDQVPTSALPLGRLTPVRFTLFNYGSSNGAIRFNTADDEGKNSSRELIVAPGQGVPVVATFSFTNLGFHWARAWLEGDAATGASQAALGFWTKEAQKALVLGDARRYGALALAISPGGNSDLSGIKVEAVSPDQLAFKVADHPVCVLSAYSDWKAGNSTARALEEYVRSGGTAFIVPTEAESSGSLGAFASPLDLTVEGLNKLMTPDSMLILQSGDNLWRDLRDGEGKPMLGLLKVFQYRNLHTNPEWQPLLTSGNGATLLARRTLGKGTILASGVAFLPGWSSLPLKPGFVVLIQNSLFGLKAETLPVRNLAAGEEIQLTNPSTSVSLHSVAGNPLSWEGAPRELESLAWSGVYTLHQGEQDSWAAVSAVAEEAKPDFLPRAKIPLLVHLPHHVFTLANEQDVTQVVPGLRGSGSAFYGWFLALALVVLLLETWLSNQRRGAANKKLLEALQPWVSKPKPTPTVTESRP